jgi:hypothetical protein
LEVRVGNVETSDGGRQVFGVVAGSDTDIAVQILRSIEAVRRTAATKVTAFTDEPGRKDARATIVAEVEWLRWRIWNGKAKNAKNTFVRIRKVMHLYKGERDHRTRGWHPENFGMSFTRSTNISVARAPGLSTTPLDTAPACVSGLR